MTNREYMINLLLDGLESRLNRVSMQPGSSRRMGKYSTWANCLYRYDRNGFWILSESN